MIQTERMNMTVFGQEKDYRKRQSGILRKYGSPGHSGKTEGCPDGKEKAGGDIRNIDENIHGHRPYRILHSDEPTFEHEHGKSGGSRPYPYIKIGKGQLFDLPGAVYDEEGALHHHPLQNPHSQSTEHGCDKPS